MIDLFSDRKVVLASASPQRLQLLEQLGLNPLVQPVAVDEIDDPQMSPAILVRENAMLKAWAAANECGDAVIIAADTVVALNNKLMGKPGDAIEAVTMLRQLSGKTHSVYTAVCLIDTATGAMTCGQKASLVTFSKIDDSDINAYIATGEPLDKAGAYGIQGIGGMFVERIDGDYGTVVGLSLSLLRQLAINLREINEK